MAALPAYSKLQQNGSEKQNVGSGKNESVLFVCLFLIKELVLTLIKPVLKIARFSQGCQQGV